MGSTFLQLCKFSSSYTQCYRSLIALLTSYPNSLRYTLLHTHTRQVTAKDRPENSLLEAAVDVERATRVAPAITVEKTASLEDVIRQRILADKFDDVAPKVCAYLQVWSHTSSVLAMATACAGSRCTDTASQVC
jgi:Mpp10 protein